MGNQGFVMDNYIGNKFQQNLDSHWSLVKQIYQNKTFYSNELAKKEAYLKSILVEFLLTNQKVSAGADFRIEPTCIIITLGIFERAGTKQKVMSLQHQQTFGLLMLLI